MRYVTDSQSMDRCADELIAMGPDLVVVHNERYWVEVVLDRARRQMKEAVGVFFPRDMDHQMMAPILDRLREKGIEVETGFSECRVN